MKKELVVKKGDKYEMPFSRGILAQSLTMTGLDLYKAYSIAEEIKSELIGSNISEIDSKEIKTILYEKIKEEDGRIAERFRFWQSDKAKRGPIIILIGGTSGIGTTTTAFEVAKRMGIRNIIGTDSIREVMRKVVSSDIAPALQKSSFVAWKASRIPRISRTHSKVILGFIEQLWYVCVGIEAVIDRAIKEGISLVIEGIHMVPGFIEERYLKNPKIHNFLLKLESEDAHMIRYLARDEVTHQRRPANHYLSHFSEIREIQDFILKEGEKYKSPIFDSFNIEEVEDIIVDRVIENVLKRGEVI